MNSEPRNPQPGPRWDRATSVALWLSLALLVAIVLLWQQPAAPLPELAPPKTPAAHKPAPEPDDTVAVRPGTDDAEPDEDHSPPDSTAQPRPSPPRASDGETARGSAGSHSLLVENVTVRDLDGRVEFRGTVDLAPTLARIERGDRLRFAHDGSKFSNREGRLPHKPSGYYHEFVHPTPGLSGPGPQRVIVGREGEVYYTFDHYQTFRRIK